MASASHSLFGLLLRGVRDRAARPSYSLFRSSPAALRPTSCLLAPNPIRLFRGTVQPRSESRSQSEMEELVSYTFGPYKIHRTEVFHSTLHSFAMVNLRPLLPGHVLVCPRREVKRFIDLTADEVCDLWLTAKEVGGRLERHHEASSLTFAIQDGPQAGQTVPHVHIHILPRKKGDFEKNDEIYDAIDLKEKELKEKLDLDKERKDRTPEEMAREADEYRALFS
ncbi:bifunctional bis(5'-adenosyl)-triphosphatase/adenylylsulfatase FHIT [Musa acuminata AAA Group]|uniref:Bis(5'-adenosyl)-triphosphatase n=1 Tax=Musa acuminata subsp. malaccensis TaxID=214687 RepID=A0A804L4U6_MUSAM|nr:PREDICTED: bifunctional bis(5'-adenosyl)-triphosphatase/adenylylsulfatase FHIT-like [Musa acuminata subsp. malaccensis]